MIIDYKQNNTPNNIQADICIIGAGAAGITLAREFSGSELNICVLESGGVENDSDTQDLYRIENTGTQDTLGLNALRLRYFGGTTNHWGGICGPYNEIDFEKRDWVPYSGWPFDKKELDPYYERAHGMLNLGPYEYSTKKVVDEDKVLPTLAPEKMIHRYFRLSTPIVRFADKFRLDLENANNITVYLNVNVTTLEANEHASLVNFANIATLDGKKGVVKARYFIVACGGIENARLLLLSNSVVKNGLGNHNDVVGRFYTTHPHTYSATVVSDKLEKLAHVYDIFVSSGIKIKPKLCPSFEAQRSKKILNCSATVDYENAYDTGFDALIDVKRDILSGDWPDEFGEKISRILTDYDRTFNRVYDRIVGNPESLPIKSVHLECRAEQSPNPQSRVYLSDKKDSLGLYRAILDWQLSDIDKRTVRVTNQLIAEEFGRLGLGRIKLHDWLLNDENEWPTDYMTSYGHHIGTTRIAEDSRYGVVNSQCQVHSVSNLFIAGSSVFPTSSYINPTLTVVAMSLRLADYLKKQLLA